LPLAGFRMPELPAVLESEPTGLLVQVGLLAWAVLLELLPVSMVLVLLVGFRVPGLLALVLLEREPALLAVRVSA